jgi:hypothetical protein
MCDFSWLAGKSYDSTDEIHKGTIAGVHVTGNTVLVWIAVRGGRYHGQLKRCCITDILLDSP